MTVVAAVDVGGTKVLACLVDTQGRVGERVELPTEEAEQTVLDALRLLLEKGERPIAVGVGVAGYVAEESGEVIFAPNLRLDHADLRSRLISQLALPVVVENDASAAAWGEFRFGGGRGATSMILLTIGTGVGGGIVIGGKLYRGALGFAGEFGHMTISEEGRQCACGLRGCLEAMASGTAIEAFAAQTSLGDDGVKTGEQVAQAALSGDERAIEVLSTAGHHLGVGVGSLVNAFDPEVVVIGGGVAEDHGTFIESMQRSVQEHLQGRRPVPKIARATLGNDAGAVGVADLARIALESG